MIKARFLSNLLLSLIWVAITGTFSLENFLFGFALSFFLLWLTSTNRRQNKYFNKVPKLFGFIFFFLYELVKANIEVAYEVITPKYSMEPGIVKIPLDAKSDMEITLLANLITLTPGTLSLGVSDDRTVLYVHTMYVKDKEEFIDGIKNGFEKRLLDILR
ncbi:multisubunit Na+/H+ antiporter, MnhE subunit [Belliella baltica DSM 15883]|uniref:Multisubunit Na+/H+ antiporter, MnhE subunit n=1 Tax=Belliella baltica (strain DSM 15883 / CIP 108006 / LMG 21964 / BA134) TaxID=866536 RepID=I3Z8Q0_BELBD|nr:Na+/H+ antiporter subunit E [Belliella baltica]AFL85618.1 multisubunit Na+/H+ antiporter, MnhE subunit [Belliella baltica DSM 15883]